jgi:hypothetical protein
MRKPLTTRRHSLIMALRNVMMPRQPLPLKLLFPFYAIRVA